MGYIFILELLTGFQDPNLFLCEYQWSLNLLESRYPPCLDSRLGSRGSFQRPSV